MILAEPRLVVDSSPHLRSNKTVSTAMFDVMIALIPIVLVSIYFYQQHAIFTIAVCMITAVLTELIIRKLTNRKPTINDGSALLTGLFVALLFSSTVNVWTAVFATILAIGVAKELVGGLGWNLFNPAIFGRSMIIILSPLFLWLNDLFAEFYVDLGPVDVMTQATPLAMLQGGMEMPSYWEMFVAFPGGALSETSPLALLIGGIYLLYRGHINWRIPVSVIGTVVVLSLIAGADPLYQVLSGGIMIGAFFMATDWVTSPITNKGKFIFGLAIGALIVLFRLGLGATEGVAFSILIMNAFVPLIDKKTKHPSFSEPEPVKQTVKEHGETIAES